MRRRLSAGRGIVGEREPLSLARQETAGHKPGGQDILLSRERFYSHSLHGQPLVASVTHGTARRRCRTLGGARRPPTSPPISKPTGASTATGTFGGDRTEPGFDVTFQSGVWQANIHAC